MVIIGVLVCVAMDPVPAASFVACFGDLPSLLTQRRMTQLPSDRGTRILWDAFSCCAVLYIHMVTGKTGVWLWRSWAGCLVP